jgi:hypothetical protein
VIDGDIEEAGDLLGVEVHGEDAIDAGGGEEIGDELCGDRDAGLVLAVLAGVAEEGDDGGDAVRAGPAGGVHHDEKLHEVLIGGWAGGLDDEYVAAADVLVDADEGLAIGEGADGGIAEGHLDEIGDLLGQREVRGTGENLQFRCAVDHVGGKRGRVTVRLPRLKAM